MNGRWLMPLIALGAGSLLADIARAGGRDPLVIPGIGPESAGRQPVYAQTPARAPMRQVASSGLGGGLIEFLVTGRDGSGRPAAAAPLMHPVAMQPAQAASNDYGAQREQLLSVQRGL